MTNKKPFWFSSSNLVFTRLLAFCVLSLERFWPRVLPSLLSLLFLASLAWFGVFKLLPYWPHFLLLWFLLFIVFGGLFFLTSFRFPKRHEIDSYIETHSHLSNQPLSSLNDKIANNQTTSDDENSLAHILWLEHQKRMAEKLQNLHIALPKFALHRYDPYALHSLVILFAAIAFVFSFGSLGGRFLDILAFQNHNTISSLRVDAWVTPPEYSGEATVYLNNNTQQTITVLRGSKLNMQISDGHDIRLTVNDDMSGETYLQNPVTKEDKGLDANVASEADKNVASYIVDLQNSANIALNADFYQKKWHFLIKEDKAPIIEFTKTPARILTGSLELNYKIDDDIAVTKAYAEITPLNDTIIEPHPLYGAPIVDLYLPRSGKGEAKTVQDISNHPWAGSEVKIRLVAMDGAGHRSYSQSHTMTLPQRIFANPLSRAVVEQRRILVTNTFLRDKIMDMSAALLVRPTDTYNNMTQFIALKTARTRLSLAKNDEELRDVADYMWQIALNIEGDLVDQAEKRLKMAQAALRDALRNGASAEEIERLTEILKQAMNEYIAALSQQAQQNNFAQMPDTQLPTLSPDELAEKLQKLEDMAKTGNRGAAEELLSELEAMMNNLQVIPGQAGEGQGQANNQKNQMQKEIDKLADIMRRQQQSLNDTHNLEEQFQNGEKSEEEYQKQLDDLKQQQEQLQEDLNRLQDGLNQQGLNPTQPLDDARDKMAKSGEAMGEGLGQDAVQNQSEALDSMRQAAQDLMQQMQEAMNKNGQGQKNGENASQDPLGRQDGNSNTENNNSLSDENDMQKAKRILEELRKKLGKSSTPELEKQYLEKLLQFD